MATKPKTAPGPTTKAETDADAALPPIPTYTKAEFDGLTNRPKFAVVDGAFTASGTDEGDISFPLKFKTRIVNSLPIGVELLEQVFLLLAERPDVVESLNELDISDARLIARKVFQAYQEKQEATLGE